MFATDYSMLQSESMYLHVINEQHNINIAIIATTAAFGNCLYL